VSFVFSGRNCTHLVSIIEASNELNTANPHFTNPGSKDTITFCLTTSLTSSLTSYILADIDDNSSDFATVTGDDASLNSFLTGAFLTALGFFTTI